MGMSFLATIRRSGPEAVGIEIPADVVAGLGAGLAPAVRVTVHDHTYRTTLAARRGRYMAGMSNADRRASGVHPGEELLVGIELDADTRPLLVPEPLRVALERDPAARSYFAGLPRRRQRALIDPILRAAHPAVRRRRADAALVVLRTGRGA